MPAFSIEREELRTRFGTLSATLVENSNLRVEGASKEALFALQRSELGYMLDEFRAWKFAFLEELHAFHQFLRI